jgi:transcription-repair coupling factor (superfamily II helicase)
MRLRQLAREKEVETIEHQKNVTIIKFSKEKQFQSEQLWQVVNKNRRYLSLLSGKGVTLKVKASQQDEKDYLRYLITILEQVG